MKKSANIRLSKDATLFIEYDDSNAKLTAKEVNSGKTGSVTLSSGAKGKSTKEE